MVDITASLDAATQQVLGLLAQLRLSNVRAIAVQDIGAADAIQLQPIPNVTSYGADLLLLVDVAAPNATTSPRLAIQGLPPVSIVAADGSPPVPGTVAGKRLIGFSSLIGGGFTAKLIGLSLADMAVQISQQPHGYIEFPVGSTLLTVPANVYWMYPNGTAGGGAGGAGNASNYGWGGAGGGQFEGWVPVVPGQQVPVYVGQGGQCPNLGSPGGPGQPTSFGSYATANPGQGGPANQSGIYGTSVALGGTATGVAGIRCRTGGNGGAPLGTWTPQFTPGSGGAPGAYGSGGIAAAGQLGQQGNGAGAGGAGGASTSTPVGQLGGNGTNGFCSVRY